MLVADEQHETRRQCGSIAQLGEHLPYKQGVTGSSPVVPTKFWPGSSVGQNASLSRQRSSVRTRSGSPKFASVAQSVEQGTENPRVGGSIPPGGTNKMRMQLIWQSATLPRWRQRVRAPSSAPLKSTKPQTFGAFCIKSQYGVIAKW